MIGGDSVFRTSGTTERVGAHGNLLVSLADNDEKVQRAEPVSLSAGLLLIFLGLQKGSLTKHWCLTCLIA
jgi:hypothetical protein